MSPAAKVGGDQPSDSRFTPAFQPGPSIAHRQLLRNLIRPRLARCHLTPHHPRLSCSYLPIACGTSVIPVIEAPRSSQYHVRRNTTHCSLCRHLLDPRCLHVRIRVRSSDQGCGTAYQYPHSRVKLTASPGINRRRNRSQEAS